MLFHLQDPTMLFHLQDVKYEELHITTKKSSTIYKFLSNFD